MNVLGSISLSPQTFLAIVAAAAVAGTVAASTAAALVSAAALSTLIYPIAGLKVAMATSTGQAAFEPTSIRRSGGR